MTKPKKLIFDEALRDAEWRATWYEAHIEDCRRSVDYWKKQYEKQRQRAVKAEQERDGLVEALIHAKHAINELISDCPNGEWTYGERTGWKGIGEDAISHIEKTLNPKGANE